MFVCPCLLLHSIARVCLCLSVPSSLSRTGAHVRCFQHFFITLTRLQPEHNPVLIVFLDGTYVVTVQACNCQPNLTTACTYAERTPCHCVSLSK